MGSREKTAGAHLTNGEIAAYLDHKLSAADQARVEGHLAECEPCRAEVLEVAGLLESLPRRTRWYVAGPAAAAVAAAVVLFLMFRPGEISGPRPPVMRGDQAPAGEATASIEVVTPAAGQTISPESLVFTWRAAGTDAHYRLTLTDEDGDIVWSTALSDTSYVLPPELVLQRGRVYFWYADALLPDGRSVTTGVREFRTLP